MKKQLAAKIGLLIIALLTILTLLSCSTQRRVERKCEKAAYKWGCDWGRDTAYIKETVTNIIYKDTTVYIQIPGESVHDSIPVFVEITTEGIKLSTPKNTLETSLAKSEAWVDNGKLRHTLIQKDSTYKALIRNAIKITQHFMKESTVRVVKEHYLTKFDKFMINSAKTFYLIIVLATLAFVVLNKLIYKK